MMIREIPVAALVALVAGLTLVGCSSSGSSSPPASGGAISGQLTGVWDASFKGALAPIVQRFESKDPSVKVNINYAGGDLSGLISTQLQAGTAPDLLLTFPGGDPGGGANLNVVTLASQGKLMDLSGEAWTSTVPKVWQSSVDYQGKTYAYPGVVQGLTAIYNKTRLDQLHLNIPATMSEVYQLCAAAKSAGAYAYAQALGDATGGGPQMLSFAQTMTLVYGPDPQFTQQQLDGKATFQNSGWKTQFQIYNQMYKDGCFGPGALGQNRSQSVDAVASGQALGTVTVTAALALLQKEAPQKTFVIAPMPATGNAADTYAVGLPAYTFAVNANTKNPAAAKAFMEFLAQPGNANLMAGGFNALPVIPNGEFVPPANLKQFADLVKQGRFGLLPTWPNAKVQSDLNEDVQGMLLGKNTSQSALAQMQSDLTP
jgi:raffinose/stachyose/melibiose transport system substrate-binding protein